MARTVFNRITPDSPEIDAAAKKAYGCKYIFADVLGELDRAEPIAGGFPGGITCVCWTGKTGEVVSAYVVWNVGLAANPIVIESGDP